MFKNIAKFLLVFATTALFMLSSGASAGAKAQTVKVGVYDNPPKIYLDKTGKPQGLYADIVNAIAAKEGWNVEYVPGTWNEGLQRLENGQIDIMVDVAVSDERRQG
ncbi:MAG TPA: transporter substrate-binding domain-containing protein [Patescibacteria group bacterium]|nr:transporter substrate-binding domain-containing protein [Patescibacteria group bacterium]